MAPIALSSSDYMSNILRMPKRTLAEHVNAKHYSDAEADPEAYQPEPTFVTGSCMYIFDWIYIS
jgi:hypothetical protein